MKFGDLGLRTKIMSGGLVPVLLSTVVFIVALVSLGAVLKGVYWVDYTHRAVRITMEVYEDALLMEASMRGFLLTGDEHFLEPYNHGSENIDKGLTRLQQMVTSEDRRKKVIEIEEIIEGWKKNSAEPAIALRREIGNARDMNDLAAVIGEAKGRKIFEQFREQVNKFIDAQRGVLEKHKAEAAQSTGVEQLREAVQTTDELNQVMQQALEIYVAALDMETGQRGYLLTGKEESLRPYHSGAKRLLDLMEKEKETVVGYPGQLQLVDEMETTLKAWINDVADPEIKLRRQISASKTMRDMQAWVSTGQDKRSFDQFRAVMDEFKIMLEKLLQTRQQASDDAAGMARSLLIAGMIVTFLAAVGISFVLSGSITRPLAAAVAVAEGISQGDLSREIQTGSKDETGRLFTALRRMSQYLRDQTLETREGISVMAASAAEISATATQLASSTTKTSSAVSETTTTVEQVKQAAKLSSSKARKVAEVSAKAVEVSHAGKKAAEDTIDRMNLIKEQMEAVTETVVRLSDQSRAIEDIIGAVQDLADQSNLLAVNASIEAARAGDQGKGFAVVAQEIKSLADQSRDATEQIRSILEETKKWVSAVVMATEQGIKAVDAGVRQSLRAGDSLHSLTGSVNEASLAAAVIDTSTEQQFVGVDQVSAAMANIEQAMQQNMAGTNQLEAAAKRIEDLGNSLHELVQRYKIER